MLKMNFGRIVAVCAAILAAALPARATMKNQTGYIQFNLVGEKEHAKHHDPNLVNPWGVAFGPKTFIWISDNNAGVSTLYGPNGVKEPLTVTIPPPSGSTGDATPTGIVFNDNQSNFQGAFFIFATEDGTISEWDGSNPNAAALKVDNPHFNSGTDPVNAVSPVPAVVMTARLLRECATARRQSQRHAEGPDRLRSRGP